MCSRAYLLDSSCCCKVDWLIRLCGRSSCYRVDECCVVSFPMKVIFAVLGILFLCLDAALDVEKAYLGVYHGLACPLIANEIDLLKVCAIVTAIAIPAAIG